MFYVSGTARFLIFFFEFRRDCDVKSEPEIFISCARLLKDVRIDWCLGGGGEDNNIVV